MELLYKEKHIEIYLDHNNSWLYARWMGDQGMLSVRQGCEKMLEAVKQTGVAKVLNDNREVTSSWSEAAEWGGKIWFPAMAGAGVKYFSWIYSPFAFSRLSTDTAISFSRNSPEIATFDDAEAAKAWLRSKPDPKKEAAE